MGQMTLDAAKGEALKQTGLDEAEASDARFIETMREQAIAISRRSSFVTSDNLRIIAETLGLHPKSQNAWGAVFSGKRWKVVGRTKSAVPSNHGREIKVWRYEETQ